MLFRFLLMSLVALGLGAGGARADYAFQFADATGAATNAFTVQQGSTVDVRVYLVQDGAGTSNGLGSPGLSTAGVQLNTQTPSIANVTAVAGNGAFGNVATTTGANAGVSEQVTGPTPVTAPAGDPNRVLLGTFTFTGLAGGSTLTVNALPGSGSDNTLADGTSIDNLIGTSSAVITVVVPEPGTMLLTGLLASGIAGAAWRRRALKAAQAS